MRALRSEHNKSKAAGGPVYYETMVHFYANRRIKMAEKCRRDFILIFVLCPRVFFFFYSAWDIARTFARTLSGLILYLPDGFYSKFSWILYRRDNKDTKGANSERKTCPFAWPFVWIFHFIVQMYRKFNNLLADGKTGVE